ncbi:DUF4365 domain-containing protein [Bosea sp. BK604]|uniref:DUF4365 domain-containing protein n=1 Tax=Bosea sp. BK604 TaxID=2512180 RepID=UPI001405475A|nr:DUF4365 domain-containing protein [Bosea sp. BK604]
MKKLHKNQLLGDAGVSRFAARVADSGLVFHPISGTMDTGIDGFIELRDPETGEVRAQFVAAQLKTVSTLAEDNGETFTYRPEARDLEHWYNASVPVILVVVQPTTELICWKSIQTYFQDPERKRARKVTFVRGEDELTSGSASKLADLVARFARPGAVTPSMRVEEELEINLLRASYPYRLNIASTELVPAQISPALKEVRDRPPIDWVYHDGRIVAFRDLDDPLFARACDRGSIDQIETHDWVTSENEVTKRLFVRLLSLCLGERLRERLMFDQGRRYHYFKSNPQKRGKRVYTFKDGRGEGKKTVVSLHGLNKTKDGASYVRHAAFVPRFLELDGEWFLAVEPTYHFTRDGFNESPYGSDYLKRIKEIERNSNVRGHVRMWRALLTESGDLLHDEYPFLSFEALAPLPHAYGVPDELWSNREDPEMSKARRAGQSELDL